MPIFARDTFVYRVIRLNCPDLSVPDVHFKDAHIKAVFAAGGVPDYIFGLLLTV
jgi:hypothetical protein